VGSRLRVGGVGFDVDRRVFALAGACAHVDVFDLRVPGVTGSSGVVRAACGEGPGAKLGAASPTWCAITTAASGPALRAVKRGTAGRGCEEGTSCLRWGWGAAFPRRRSSTPVLVAVNVVRPRPHRTRAAGAPRGPLPHIRRGRQRSRNGQLCSDPAGWVVGSLVADHGVGDAGGAVRQGAGDDPAAFAAGFQPGGVAFRARITHP
jgi:hypothetical protein